MALTVLERALIAGPTGLSRGLVAPLQLQLTASDRLRVNYALSDAVAVGATLQVNYRILAPDGALVVGQEVIPMLQDFLLHAVDLPLRDGFLLSLVVKSVFAAIYGQVYVSAYVYTLQGAGFDLGAPSDLILAPLVQGFPTSQAALTWPGSLMINAGEPAWGQRVYRPAAPGAGNQWTYTVGAGRENEILSASGLFTTSAAPANRLPILKFLDDLGNQFWNPPRVPVITAGQQVRLTWSVGTGHDNTLTTDVFTDSLPNIFRLLPAFQVQSGVFNMQAGDTWTQINVTVRERINLA